ncbi:hypothetical protein J5N97_000438 [Dioscorea zingiberensis]|uniref:Uncharacterized protein n=1 Tax=Dioscorea zingiberensis TaxID=325984 RepID=A0A9D5H1J9_9LILI|nr:hypothetical protein J5N97_000438 [Dioscorea zingiberensis]
MKLREDSQVYDKPRRRRSVAPSPISARSEYSQHSNILLQWYWNVHLYGYPVSMGTPRSTMGTPYSFSVQYDPDDGSYDEDLKNSTYPPPSQWRLEDECTRVGTSITWMLGCNRMSLLVQAVFGATFVHSRTCADMETIPCDDSSAATSHWELLCKEYLDEEYGKRFWGLFGATLAGPKKESIKQSYVSGALACLAPNSFNTAATALAYWYGGEATGARVDNPKASFSGLLDIAVHCLYYCRSWKHDLIYLKGPVPFKQFCNFR